MEIIFFFNTIRMSVENQKKNLRIFALIDPSDPSFVLKQFRNSYPRNAAMKAATSIDRSADSVARNPTNEKKIKVMQRIKKSIPQLVHLHEMATDRVHVFTFRVWKQDSPRGLRDSKRVEEKEQISQVRKSAVGKLKIVSYSEMRIDANRK